MRIQQTKTITAQNTFTEWVRIVGTFQLLISGLASSTVTFQGSPDGGTTIYDIQSWNTTSDNTLHVGTVANSVWWYRVGIKTGGYGSDTVVLRLEA